MCNYSEPCKTAFCEWGSESLQECAATLPPLLKMPGGGIFRTENITFSYYFSEARAKPLNLSDIRQKKPKKKIEHWHVISAGLILYDVCAAAGAYFMALLLRFDWKFSMIPANYLAAYRGFVWIYIIFVLVVFWHTRLYNSIWRFASYDELLHIMFATIVTFLFHTIGITILFCRMPVSYYIFGVVIQFLLTVGIRFSYRFVLLERKRRTKHQKEMHARRVMLIGAGAAGRMILRDIKSAKEAKDVVCCIIDDNSNKWGRFIDGVPVVGGRDYILYCAEKYEIDKILFAIPSISAAEKRDIMNICKETDCELKSLPGLYQLYNGEVTVSQMRDVSVEDLLGRDPICINQQEVFDSLTGKVILVTGGGGSIGSELCRQIASHSPKQLIIFDMYENNAYDIQMELQDAYPDLNLETIIGSVRDSRKVDTVFATYRPEIVFHAAAHKHVPLMEDSPCEAIKNNAMGTYKVAFASALHGCKRFVLISTDKAVNPTNIMGASKRLCEMIVQSFDKKIKAGKTEEIPCYYTHGEDGLCNAESMKQQIKNAKTEYVAVRFGNVLGSNGSVIPLFKKQIAKGGPVTVTHPDIVRYFMTIPEAVSLVLQAATYAKGGEIFVLDMGSPMKIEQLARNLIRFSGFHPDEDIKIEYTGLRPGEKLYEEKLMAEEGLKKTKNELIYIGKPIEFDSDEFLRSLKGLMDAAYKNQGDIRELVKEVVGTYKVG